MPRCSSLRGAVVRCAAVSACQSLARGADCMRGAARTVSGLGSSTGYFSPVDMAGFQAPVQCWPDFLLAASPRAHTRCFPANQPWHQAPRRPPSLHQAFGGAALAAQGADSSCVTAPKCATVLPCGSVAA